MNVRYNSELCHALISPVDVLGHPSINNILILVGTYYAYEMNSAHVAMYPASIASYKTGPHFVNSNHLELLQDRIGRNAVIAKKFTWTQHAPKRRKRRVCHVATICLLQDLQPLPNRHVK
jgi:hypothetical protein